MLSDNTTGPMLEAFERSVEILRSADATTIEHHSLDAVIMPANLQLIELHLLAHRL
jgi:hypothetical protein